MSDRWQHTRVRKESLQSNKAYFSHRKIPHLRVKPLLFIWKYQSWKHNSFALSCAKNSIPKQIVHTHRPLESESCLSFVRSWIFLLFAIKFTAIQEAAQEARGKDTNIASASWSEYCVIVNKDLILIILLDYLVVIFHRFFFFFVRKNEDFL